MLDETTRLVSIIKQPLAHASPRPWHTPGEVFHPMFSGHNPETYCAIGIGNGSTHIGYASVTGCIDPSEAAANADLIVRAVNEHAALTAVAEAARAVANAPSFYTSEHHPLQRAVRDALVNLAKLKS